MLSVQKTFHHRDAEGTEPHPAPRKNFHHEEHEEHEAQQQPHPGRKDFNL